LIGHPTYYPRFGYRTGVYGEFGISVTLAEDGAEQLATRELTEADVPALQELWLHEEREVDLTLRPGPTLLDWISPNPQIAALVWLRAGQIVGYTRVHAAEPARPRVFLAADHAAARAMAAALTAAAGVTELRLPLHERCASAAAFGPAEGRAWDAAMACSLRPCPFDDFYAALQTGQRPPGRVIWPPSFDLR
jgi:putative acetyltransferase